MKKIILAIAGALLILVGIAGLILPVMPGWALIFFGLSFIAPAFAARLKRRVLRKFFKKEIVYLDEWKKLNVHTGFTTRHFPLVLHKAADLLDVSNQNFFVGTIHAHLPPVGRIGKARLDKFVFLEQVHGDHVEVLEDAEKFKQEQFIRLSAADGVLTNLKNVMLLVLTADCLSIYLSAGKGQSQWIGLVHAGWRGAEKNIAKKAFKMIRDKSGCAARDIRVILGPRIGKNHYEVGEEFQEYFPVGARSPRPTWGEVTSPLRQKNGRLYFDLAGKNKRQLLEAGASRDRIVELGICTVSENEDFYSFRKEKEAAGRIISFISKF